KAEGTETMKKPDGDTAVREKIAAMPEPFRTMGERVHALVLAAAPALQPTLFYGMPPYAKGGKTLCFFRADQYMTFGLTEKAHFQKGKAHQLMPSAGFLSALDAATEAALAEIVRVAAS